MWNLFVCRLLATGDISPGIFFGSVFCYDSFRRGVAEVVIINPRSSYAGDIFGEEEEEQIGFL